MENAKPVNPAAPYDGAMDLAHEEIALRAYAIYEANGRPEGRADDHWRLAEQMIREEHAAAAALANENLDAMPIAESNAETVAPSFIARPPTKKPQLA